MTTRKTVMVMAHMLQELWQGRTVGKGSKLTIDYSIDL